MTPGRLDESRILAVLASYVSASTAAGILRSVAAHVKRSPRDLESADPAALIDAIGASVGPFVSQSQRAALTTELKSTPPPPVTSARYAVRGDVDVGHARLGARELCRTAGAPGFVAQQVATCVSELARNIVQYAGAGEIEMTVQRTPRRGITVRATDEGPGIPHLEQIYAGGYRSTTGQGRGLLGIRRVAHRFDLATGPTGTRIEFETWF